MIFLKKFRGLFISLILFSVVIVTTTRCQEKTEVSKSKAIYQCSMHPNIISSKADNCPICGMKLTRAEDASTLRQVHSEHSRTAQGEKKILFYRNPMNPEVTSPVPAKDEMGMDYIPVYAEEKIEGPSIPGHATVFISPEKQQLIGMKFETVMERDLTKVIRAAGRVAFDARLFDALLEYKRSLVYYEKDKRGSVAIYREKAGDILDAAVAKLKLQGYNEDIAGEFLKAGKSLEYDHLVPGNAGIYAEIYEYEMGLVKTGQETQITAPAFPGKIFKGNIYAIDPVLNAMTRTLKVRIVVGDEAGELKPEMFVDVEIKVPLDKKLAVPTEALFNTGDRQIVFVDKREGHIEPREVKVGQEAEGFYEVISGVEKGERVATSANFLIDSESRFQSVVQSFRGDGHD